MLVSHSALQEYLIPSHQNHSNYAEANC